MTETHTKTPKQAGPSFASREEEAEFWDQHDLTDIFEFETLDRLDVEQPLSEAVTLHVDAETADEVKAIARRQGVPWDGLLSLWIVERRDEERRRRCEATD